MFETYASLITFAAARGFQYAREVPGAAPGDGAPPPPFLDAPAPVSYEVFRNQRLRPILLLIAIAHHGNARIASDADAVCRLIEDYAALGGEELMRQAGPVDAGAAGRLAYLLTAAGVEDGLI